MSGFRRLGEETLYEGWVLRLTKGTFEAPDGSTFEREVLHHPGAVAAIPVFDNDDIVLVRQYRPALDEYTIEIPAGVRDVEAEPVEVTAQRELGEEVGLHAEQLELLLRIHNVVGYGDEEIVIFLATGLSEVERELTDSPEEHEMEILRVPLRQAEDMIFAGDITDVKTVIAVLAVLRARR